MIIKTLITIEQKAVHNFKKQLLDKLGKDILLIQLFGSKARGDFRGDSDTDILVILKKPTENQINFIYDLTMGLVSKYGVYLSVKIFSEKEFEYYKNIPTLFIRNVLKEGIKLA